MLKKSEKETAPKTKAAMKKELTKEQIETAAYYKWLERGCPHGDAMKDWLDAEKKLSK